MNDLKGLVTPLTRGVIWLTGKDSTAQNPIYADIDYLLDGLLTANVLERGELKTSRVIVGRNFGELIYVLIVKEINPAEIRSFVTLVKNGLVTENDILVIDEQEALPKLKEELKEISNHLKVVQ